MQVKRDDLNKACNKVARIKSNKNFPISDYILLKFCSDSKQLLVRATDNYVYVECTIACEGEVEDAEYIVEAGKFIKLIGKTTKDTIKFTKKDNTLQVKGNGSYKYELLDDDFLDIPPFSEFDVYDVDLKLLKPAMLDAIKCKSSVLSIPLSAGICINKDSVWGTDGGIFVAHDFESGVNERIVIADNLCTLIPCLDDGSAVVYIDSENNKCAIQSESTLIYGSLVSGAELYPDLSRLFAITDRSILTINRAEVLQAIDRLSIFTDETDSSISIAVIENGVGLTVGGKSMEQVTLKHAHEVVPTTLTVSMASLKHIVALMQNDYIEIQYARDEANCGALFISDGLVNAGMGLLD